MARKRNPRRILVAELREWRRFLGLLIDFWDVTGKVAEVHSEGGRVMNHTFRERRYEEYRENVPANWAQMARNARGLAAKFEEIAAFCDEQWAEARARLKDSR